MKLVPILLQCPLKKGEPVIEDHSINRRASGFLRPSQADQCPQVLVRISGCTCQEGDQFIGHGLTESVQTQWVY